jgi:metal-responsive CopG/Arc/MetJ family transcriptional regulator
MARVLISLPKNLLKALDDFCEEADYQRSEFLRHFIREFIIKERNQFRREEQTDILK